MTVMSELFMALIQQPIRAVLLGKRSLRVAVSVALPQFPFPVCATSEEHSDRGNVNASRPRNLAQLENAIVSVSCLAFPKRRHCASTARIVCSLAQL
jgi:hypothetical protein